jgi:hypothetical protein
MTKMVHRSAAAALLAPMLLFAISAGGFTGLRCRITGMVSLATCCGGAAEDAGQHPAGSDSVDEPGCCERIVVDNTRPPATGVSVARQAGVPLPVVLLIAALVPVPIPRARPMVSNPERPGRSRVSLRVLNRSLLI